MVCRRLCFSRPTCNFRAGLAMMRLARPPHLRVVGVPSVSSNSNPSTIRGPTVPATPATIKIEYPDSISGLQRLFKDMTKAQQTSAGARADALLRSLVLPSPREWYDDVFGFGVAAETEALYEKSAASVAPSIAHYLVDARSRQLEEVKAAALRNPVTTLLAKIPLGSFTLDPTRCPFTSFACFGETSSSGCSHLRLWINRSIPRRPGTNIDRER